LQAVDRRPDPGGDDVFERGIRRQDCQPLGLAAEAASAASRTAVFIRLARLPKW